MKIIEKISLTIFANLILILSVLISLVIFGWLDLEIVYNLIKTALADGTSTNIILGICVVLILLAIKCIFFDSGKKKEKTNDSILLENESGRLLVSRDTLENLTNGVVKGFENTENISSRVVLDSEHNVIVYVSLAVKPNTVIKDLSNSIQTRIKETVKASLDLEVKEVNVTIKNVAPKQEPAKEE